jgi:hypothetical protein
MHAEQDRVASVARLADEYQTITAEAQRPRWSRLLDAAGLTSEQLRHVEESSAYGLWPAHHGAPPAEARDLPVDESLTDLLAGPQSGRRRRYCSCLARPHCPLDGHRTTATRECPLDRLPHSRCEGSGP